MTPRKRQWLIALSIAAIACVLALRWIAQPSRVAGLILDSVGDALGLEITASGASEYRLRGTPMLSIRDVVARQPGAGTPLLRAERIQLTLPWSTIRARGNDLTVERVEVDAPQLDIGALQRWLATRPPSETKIPTLTDGLHIARGRVIGDGWSVEAFDLDLPSLHPDRPLRAQSRGRVLTGDWRIPFDVHVTLMRPAMRAGLGIAGNITVASGDWRLPMTPTLGGKLHSADDGLGLDRMTFGANARYLSGDTNLPFVLGLAGPLRYRDATLTLAPIGVVVHGRDAIIPDLNAHGRFASADSLALRLEGRLATWPDAWPALPPPIGASASPLPFALDYTGKPDFTDVAALRLQRGETRFDGRFRLPDLQAWIAADSGASPLPPLDGRMTTPALEISGARLEGVEIDIDDPDVAQPAKSPMR